MKLIKVVIGILIVFSQITYGQANIEIENPSTLDRTEEVIAIPWKEILNVYSFADTTAFEILEMNTKNQIQYQFENKGKNEIQNLLIQLSVPAKTKVKLRIQKGNPARSVIKTYGRYVPERMDDFAWENDKIAFRMYGRALEGTEFNANGIDVWVKRTEKMVLNERYKLAEYHVDHGDGMDYYHVGLSLGAGNMVPFVNDSIWYSKNYQQWKILDNGPLRTTFQLFFDEWDVAGNQVSAVKTISLDAGSQLSKIVVEYSFYKTPELTVMAGIVKRRELGTQIFDEPNGIMGYWEPRHGTDGTTGIGCIFEDQIHHMQMDNRHLSAIMLARPNEPIIYYTGAAWDKAGSITTAGQWFDYLRSFQQKIVNPLKIAIYK